MMAIDETVADFLLKQNVVIVATADKKGVINQSVKGIACLDPQGILYIVDLYNGKTKKNLKENLNITISAVDEELFKGWQLKGTAKEYEDKESQAILEHWDKKITERIADRIIRNIQKARRAAKYSERHLPKPKYIIEMEVNEIVDLAGNK